MPVVTEERLELIEIEFQVWCAVCGNGICNYVEEDIRRNEKLGGKHFIVSCPHCEKEKEELEKRVETLTAEACELMMEIGNLQQHAGSVEDM